MKPIPFPRFPPGLVDLGLEPFPVLAALGGLTTILLLLAFRDRRALSLRDVATIALILAGSAAIGAHLAELIFYRPDRLATEGLRPLFGLLDGLASSGALVGGAIGLLIVALRLGRDFGELADAVCEALPFGWAIGRLGCFLVHDHPGVRMEVFPAVAYPGGARLDLGLAEAVLLLVLGVLALVARRRPRPPGRLALVVLGGYALGRFLLDFARIDAEGARELGSHLGGVTADPRHLGLTPAQWLGAAFLVAVLLQRIRRKASIRFRAR